MGIHLYVHFSKPVDMRCKYNSNLIYGWAQGFVTMALWVNGLRQGTALQITPSGMAQNYSCRNKIHKNVLENLMRSGTSLIYQQSDALRTMPSLLLPRDYHWCQLREMGLKGNNGGQVKRKLGRETDKLGNEQLQSKKMVDRHHFLSCHMNLWFTKRILG